MSSSKKSSTIFDHLDELRGRVALFVCVFVVFCFIAYGFVPRIMPALIKPVGAVVFTAPGEAFSAHMLLTLLIAFILSLPVLLYQVWAFAWQALTEVERKNIYLFGPLSLVLFLAGICFAFFVVVPIATRFLLSFSSDYVVAMIGIKNYIAFVGNFVLAFGFIFELPLVLVFLVKIGIATPEFLRQYRGWSIMGILIVSALLTPPDVVSQLCMAIPLLVLYEAGVFFAVLAFRNQQKKS